MSRVFADAVYFIARLNRADQYHEKTIRVARQMRARLVTTELILLEVADGLSHSQHRSQVWELIRHLRQSPTCEIVPASSHLIDQGLEIYRHREDKHWTLTDCTSFVVMREHGIPDALTADHHFEQAGFTILLK